MIDKQFDLLVHVTHEAGFKVGGVGAVLEGLLSTTAYNAAVERTIVVGPLDTTDTTEMARLVAPDNMLQIVYSSWHRINEAPDELAAELGKLERQYRVHLLYGRRTFVGPDASFEHEVLLLDAHWADVSKINNFKRALWQHYRFESDRFEWNTEFDLVIKAAKPSYDALSLLIGGQAAASRCCLIAHEWMGIPLALCIQLQAGDGWQLVYYAHEMPTARILIEDHPGHDTRFYNALQQAQLAGLTLPELFGDQQDFFKHAMLGQAVNFDRILAVGPWVEKELRFLGSRFATADIRLVYNGVPFQEIDLVARAQSKSRLQQYCMNLLDYRPDYVFTHVTRMLVSKGLWRDIAVLDHLDRLLRQDGKTAVLYMLTTSRPAGRAVEDVLRWETEYGWPANHRSGNGDLLGHEGPLNLGIEAFNRRSRAVKIVFVNQFGWSRERCGTQMPAEMVFDDIRWGTDLEFGQSIYEPFGISQIEPLAFGALSVVSNICGCVGFVERVMEAEKMSHFSNLLQADYVSLAKGLQVYTPWDALQVNQEMRDRIESANGFSVAMAIRAILPSTEKQARALLRRGQQVSRRMSWEIVVGDFFLPALSGNSRE